MLNSRGSVREYQAKVVRVVDGDTLDVVVDLGFSINYKCRLRLRGIDTPEIYRPKSRAEYEHGVKATQFVKNLVDGKEVIIRTYKLGIYGRYEADVIIPETGQDLVTLLKEAGFEKRSDYTTVQQV